MRIICSFLIAAAISSGLLSAAAISVDPALHSVAVGDVFTLDVLLGGGSDVYGYQFDVGFNPAVLAATGVTEGPFLAAGGATFFFPGFIDNATGAISTIGSLLLGSSSGVNGGGVLASIEFTAIAAGASGVSIFNASALDSFGQDIPLTVQGATVNAAAGAVPEPSSLALLTVAAALAAGRRLQRRGSRARP